MCSCTSGIIHGYNPDQTLINNLFQLNFSAADYAGQLGFCVCPSSFLSVGWLYGIPMAFLAVMSATLFNTYRKTAIFFAMLAVLTPVAILSYLIHRRMSIVGNFDMISDTWLAISVQFGFNTILFFIIPFFFIHLMRIYLLQFEKVNTINAKNK